MIKEKIYFLLECIVFCLLLPVIVACTPVPDEPMTLATNDWLGYRPMYLAQKLAYVSPTDLHLVELTSNSEVLRHFRNGDIDAAALTLDEALLLKQDEIDIKIVLVMDISHGGDVVIARKGISTMQALRGKSVGLETTALGSYMLHRALELSGLSAREIKVIPLEYSEHEAAFVGGKVDAVVTFDPVHSRLLNVGGNVVFDSSQIPGEIIDVMVVRSQYLRDHPDKVSKILAGWFRVLESMKKNRDESLTVLASMSNMSVVDYSRAFAGLKIPDLAENQTLLGKGEASLAQCILKLKTVMLQNNLLNKSFNTTELLTSAFVAKD